MAKATQKVDVSTTGMFDGIEEARISEGGVWFKPGAFHAKVNACKALKDRKGVGVFVVETELTASSRDDLPAGTLVSWVVKLDKEPALGNIKGFAAAALGTTVNKITAEHIENLVSDDNPLAGTMLKVSAQDIITKSGHPFTKVSWLPMAEGEEFTGE